MPEIDVYKEWLGIPEGDRPPDYYTLLRCVMFEDDISRIESNYKKLNGVVRKYATGQYLKPSQDLLNELARAMLCLTDPDAKREYDQSLGRETGPDAGDEPRTCLQYLVASEIIKRGQVAEIEHFADARGLSHRDAVVQMKLATQIQATGALAKELRMSFVDLDDMLPEDDVLDMLPKQVVKRHTCLPLFEDRGKLLVACAAEASPELEDEIRLRFGMPMRSALAIPRSIQQAIARYYAPGERDEAAASKKQAVPTGKKEKKKPEKKNEKKQAAPAGDPAERRNISIIAAMMSAMATNIGLMFTTELTDPPRIIAAVVVGGAVIGIMKLTYWK